MVTEAEPKKCFVIGPIGEEGSPERIKADWLLKGIIKPVLAGDPFNYDVKRADQISEPGLITDQVIAAAIDADLAIADLTGANPNAFYELAIRHMEQKAVIHMAEKGQPLPFDIKDYRAVFYKLKHPDDLEEAKAELANQVKAIKDPAYKASNPITKARGMVELERSADSKDKLLADLVKEQRRLKERIDSVAWQAVPDVSDLIRPLVRQPTAESLARRILDRQSDELLKTRTEDVVDELLKAAVEKPVDPLSEASAPSSPEQEKDES